MQQCLLLWQPQQPAGMVGLHVGAGGCAAAAIGSAVWVLLAWALELLLAVVVVAVTVLLWCLTTTTRCM
jgi:hypothetical protein